MKTLVCTECGATKTFADGARYNGVPVEEWFVSVGSRCGSCRDRAQQLQLMALRLGPVVSSSDGSTYQEKFETFHANNPWVYHAMVHLARGLRQRGHRRIGIKMLFEVLRWQYQMQTYDPSSDFRLNNNMHSRYSRLIMDNEPDLQGIFELRELKAV